MKVLFSPSLQSNKNYNFKGQYVQNSVKQLAENKEKKQLINYSLLVGSSLAVVLAGVYILKNKKPPSNQKNESILYQECIQTYLPDETLAISLPEALKSKLSLNNNYQKLKNMFSSPDEKDIAGIGANSTVYNIDFLDEYVLKIMKPDKKADPNKIPINLFPDNINLGQPIWVHPENPRILILKKVSGVPNSVQNWSDIIYDKKLQKPVPVTNEQAQQYFDNIYKISKMQQSVFDNLAEQIKVLDVTPKSVGDKIPGFKTDSVNPNNLLVDFENNRLGVIDYFAKCNSEYQNSYMDMVAAIGDFTLFPEYYDKLTPLQQKTLMDALKIVEEKSFLAAEKIGLSTDKNVFLNFINKINIYFPIPPVKKSETEEYIRSYDIRAKAFVDLFNR